MTRRILNVLELQIALQDEQIETLVHRFYDRIRDEPLLGPVFASRIDADAWPAHLDKMVRFWSTILRGTDRYTGNPMLAHQGLPGVTPAHFTRWLSLFREVAEQCLSQPLADSILQRAERMGARLQAAAR
ncbi:MAG: group III truncated hemoglobin [Planctomycetota bacterium]